MTNVRLDLEAGEPHPGLGRRALGEMVRLLGARGRLAVAVWDALERTPAYAAEVAVIERVSGRRASQR